MSKQFSDLAAAGHPSTVLITDGDQRATLAAVRALGRAGHVVHVCAPHAHSLAGASRFATTETVVPDPLSRPAEFVTALQDLTLKVNAQILLPVTEGALLAVLPRRTEIPAIIPFASAEQFERLCDKRELLRIAGELGIPVPAQHVIDLNSSGSPAATEFPVVLKPSRSIGGASGKRQKLSVLYAHDTRQLAEITARLPPAAFPLLCQQRILGPGVAISLLLWNGTVQAAFAHRRLREKPPSGGVSVLRESIPLDPDLLEQSLALLRAFEWNGVAMVEFKVDARSGTAYLMEVNGRLWGSLQLAIDSGVDFPSLLVRCALGQTVEPVLHYPIGVRTQWELGELDHMVTRLLHSNAALSLPPGSPSRIRTLVSIMRAFLSGTHHEVFDADDAKPFLREAWKWVRRA